MPKNTGVLMDLTAVVAASATEDVGRRLDGQNLGALVFELRGTKNAGTAADITIEDSFDKGVTWNTLVTFTQLLADGAETKAPTRPHGDTLRALRTSTGNGWDLRVKAAFDPQR